MVNDNNITGTGCENLTGNLVPLENFTYDNAMMGCLITWNLRTANFSGVSVRPQHAHTDNYCTKSFYAMAAEICVHILHSFYHHDSCMLLDAIIDQKASCSDISPTPHML